MTIIYEDEYHVQIFSSNSAIMPSVGDTVIIHDDEYKVKNRTFVLDKNIIVISVSQSVAKANVTEAADSGRQHNIERTIIELTKRQEATEKDTRNLKEQLVTIRTHINQQIRKEGKNGSTR